MGRQAVGIGSAPGLYVNYKSTKRHGLFGFVTLAWLLSACTAPVKVPDGDGVADVVAKRSFDVAYRQIADRYLMALPVERLAFEGLRSVSTLDPLVTVEQSDDEVVLKQAGVVLARYVRPEADNSPAWANITSRLFNDARPHSSAISGANHEQIYRAVFDGTLSLLDSFSRYASASQALENRAKRSGYYGIGVKFRRHDRGAYITQVFPKSPAQAVSIGVNDIITHINGTPLVELDHKTMRRQFRSKKPSIIHLVVQKKGQSQPIRLAVRQKRIILPTVAYKVHGGVAIFSITGFNRKTAESLEKKLQKAQRELGAGVRGFVIDMRSNPGGLLKQAVKVADLFLKTGRIVTTRGRHPDSHHDYQARGSDIGHGHPVVVLINGRSASASEIVAAALQDHERAVVVGTGSFGKGTVQSVTRLPNQGEMTLTWSRFVTPAGYVLHGLGVPPSVCTSEYRGSAKQIIDQIFLDTRQVGDLVGAWRRVGSDDERRRKELRSKCPADGKKRKVDLEVAKLLIRDRNLYDRLLAATSQPVLSAR